jgi:hypothetical protein
MEIGIGLPNAVPGVDRDSLLEFARRGEQRGFSSLGTIGRSASGPGRNADMPGPSGRRRCRKRDRRS